MIKYHGPSFNIEDLGDFFSVDPVTNQEVDDFDSDKESCEVSLEVKVRLIR